jgi:hypothetical protein
MSENKISTYLLYAIGEILLVVIGIMIAVNFNNWNEQRKNSIKVVDNLNLLIENLQKDSLFCSRIIGNITADTFRLNSYTKRLSSATANKDTLIQISRFEFSPVIIISKFTNDDSYYAMIQSGEINLLDKTVRQNLFGLYSMHNSHEVATKQNFEFYLTGLARFQENFTLNSSISAFHGGPIEDFIWSQVDQRTLANDFSFALSSKKLHYRIVLPIMQQIQDKTEDVLRELRNQEELKN